eukprot:4668250-Pyramimonas_sp.AAC.1
MESENVAASPIHRRCVADASAMHRPCSSDVRDTSDVGVERRLSPTSSRIADALPMHRRDPPTPSSPTPYGRPRASEEGGG